MTATLGNRKSAFGSDISAMLQDEEEFESYLQRESEQFEKDLIADETDPLQRALRRRAFYMKQREMRTERKRALGSLAKRNRERSDGGTGVHRKIKNRVFEIGLPSAYNTNAYSPSDIIEYHGTLLSERIEREQQYMRQLMDKQQKMGNKSSTDQDDDLPSNPVFLGENGLLYDIHYRPIYVDPKALRDRRGKFSNVLNRRPNKSTEDKREKYLRKFEFEHDPELYQTPPNPESFESFEGTVTLHLMPSQ